MNNTNVDKALDVITRMSDLAAEANKLIDNITIDDVSSHEALTESVNEMRKLIDEMNERKREYKVNE